MPTSAFRAERGTGRRCPRGDNTHELRFTCEGQAGRITYSFEPKRIAIMLTTFRKQRHNERARASGLSQTEPAARMGTTQSVISHIENRAQVPTVAMLERVPCATGQVLNISIAHAS